jgi:hypothetical protein
VPPGRIRMSKIKYAYLHNQTWLYRRSFPRDVAVLMGKPTLKRSLKTGDQRVARTRAVEVNAHFENLVLSAREGTQEAFEGFGWEAHSGKALARLRQALGQTEALKTFPTRRDSRSVKDLSRRYLNLRSDELRHGGFKSVRYSVGLFTSKYADLRGRSLSRDEGREFLSLIAQLSPLVGKGEVTRGMGLDALVRWSKTKGKKITARTQKRIWSQVNHFLDWCVYEGELEINPFKTVRFDGKVKPSPYAVMTDQDVTALLGRRDCQLHLPLLLCLLTGMRSGEAVGLLREDLIDKGNLGTFIHVRPNELRELKTDAAERLVPMHGVLQSILPKLPAQGPLFPDLNVNLVTKRFAKLRSSLGLERQGFVFHSTRKWFITQCERQGVPEHFTASLVGHKSARSENGLTYGIYSAGISDEQKRDIVDAIRLPA